MLKTTPLRQQIDRDVFDYQQLVACLSQFSKPRGQNSQIVASGEIVRIRKGLYAFGAPLQRAPISRELLANLIYGPSYISLDYALSYHGLIPERVETVTSVTLGRSAHLHYALRHVLLPPPESEPLRCWGPASRARRFVFPDCVPRKGTGGQGMGRQAFRRDSFVELRFVFAG